MDKATQEILTEIAITGRATVLMFKLRQAKAAETLRALRLIHVEAGNDQLWIVKFGPAPAGHQPREIA